MLLLVTSKPQIFYYLKSFRLERGATTLKINYFSNKKEDTSNKKFKWRDKTYVYKSVEFPSKTDESFRINQKKITIKAYQKTQKNVKRALFGNIMISIAKLGAWFSSGSSAMLSEFIHSLVDCGNQALLLVGLKATNNAADLTHPYGYGKSIYFWALVSAVGTFWLGAGVSMRHSIEELLHPSIQQITWHVWGVLGISLCVDGYVFYKTLSDCMKEIPLKKIKSFHKYFWTIRDPATIAILLEDGAACIGIIFASSGILMAHVTQNPIYDGLAGVGISALLAGMGLVLVRLNQRVLIGRAVDPEIITGIEQILLQRRSVDNVYSVQSQWTGSDEFSYKAAIDFDGTFLAAQLIPRYHNEFIQIKDTLETDLPLLLCWYAEDVVRTIEREVRHIESEIRQVYPGATYIELEPDSKFANRFALEDALESKLKRSEIESLRTFLTTLYTDVSSLKPTKQKQQQLEKKTNKQELTDSLPASKSKT